jgi:2-oxoglutarate ferredoxin oxidoreductase subunit delta
MAPSPIRLELELCKACGICIELCPDTVFDRDNLGNPVVARPEDCSQCLLCELHCPDFAIEIRRRRSKDKTDASGAPPLTRQDLVAATSGVGADEACSRDGQDG